MTIEHRRDSTPSAEAGGEDDAASARNTWNTWNARDAWDAERRRIVRDLHDVVTHQVAAMIVQAEAARYLTGAPERLDAALTAVTDTGRRAIADLRCLSGLLACGPDSGHAPACGPGPGRVPGGGPDPGRVPAAGEAAAHAPVRATPNAEAALVPPQPPAPDTSRVPGSGGRGGAGELAGAGGAGTSRPADSDVSGPPGVIGRLGAGDGPGGARAQGPADADPAVAGGGGGAAAEPGGPGADVVCPGRGGGLQISAPCDGDLHALVEEMRLAGQPVEFAEAGRAEPSSRTAELVAYRVIQAALVDALRYAPGSRTSVEVRHGVREVVLRVRTDGAVFHAATGRDLAGVRARVEALGGEFHQERPKDGTFVVGAVIPAAIPA